MSLLSHYIKSWTAGVITIITLCTSFSSNAQFCTNPGIVTISYTITDATCNGANDAQITVTVNGGLGGYSMTLFSTVNGNLNFSSATVNTVTWTGLKPDPTITITGSAVISSGPPVINAFCFSPIESINEPGAIINSATTVNPTCNGGNNGSITSSVSGGTPGYTYSWSTGASTANISSLAAGSYTLTVTDSKGCAMPFNYTLTDPPAINAAPTITNPTCNGGSNGSIDIAISNGTAPYTYLWSNGATTQNISSLTAGSYSVTITDAEGCSKLNGPFTVTQPTAVTTLGPTIVNPTCSGGSNGSIDFIPSGGTAPYSYLWSNGAVTQDLTGIAAGSYSLALTDGNGCVFNFGPYSVTAPAGVTVPAPSITNVSCNGGNNGAIDITPAGGTAPYTYTWSTGAVTQDISGLTAGSYSVTIRDNNGCLFNFGPYTVTQPAALSVPAPVITNVSCNGGNNGAINITPAGGTAPYTYTWSNGALTQDLSALTAGSYSVTVRDANNCTFNGGPYTVTQPTALSIPAPIITNVLCNGGSTGSIDISPAGGTLPYTYVWSNGAVTQDLSGRPAGSYSVTVTDNNGCIINGGPYTITQPTPITIPAPVITPITCSGLNNGAIDITPSGGVAPYTYLWSNGFTTQDISGLSAGSYSVNVRDANNCVVTGGPYTISPAIAITVPAPVIVNVSCNGGATGSIDITPAGGTAPYTYTWSNGAITQDLSAVVAGSYSVTVRDANNCNVLAGPYTITQPSAITLPAPIITNVSCNGGNNGAINITPAGGTAPYTYTWSNGAITQDLSGVSTGPYTVTVTDANGCTFNAGPYTITEPTPITAPSIIVNANCNGGSNGSIDITPAGGSAPYTYAWSNGAVTQDISGLTAGSYTATITDANSCALVQPYTVTEPASMSVTGTPVDITCNGAANGQVNLVVSGGTAPYTYLWTNGAITQNISGLSAGSYSVTVTDANSCSLIAGPFTINEPVALSVSGVATDALCSGVATGSVDITPAGGTGAYTYSWSNGALTQDITNVLPGSYTVTVTDANGCTTNGTYTVNASTAVNVSLTPTDATCNGASTGSVTSNVTSGTAPFFYSWSNGASTANITNVAAGTYTLIVTDNVGCTANTSATVNEPAAIVVTSTVVNVPCSGGSNGSIDLTVSGGLAPYTFSWTNGASAEDINSLAAGAYTVTVTDANLCTQNASFTITQSTLSGSAVVIDESCSAANGAIDFTPAGGTAPYTYSWSNGASTEDISGLTAGSYTVTYTDASALCSDVLTITVNALALPNVTVTPTNATICNGSTVSLTASGALTYTWSPATDLNTTTGAVVISTATANITYTVTGTDAGGCINTATAVISVNPTPTGTASAAPSTLCAGSATVITASLDAPFVPAATAYSFDGGLTFQASATFNIAAVNSDTTVNVVITDVNGCTTALIPVSITLTDFQTVLTITDPTCNGGIDGSITVTSVTGGNAPYTYAINGGAFGASNTFSGLSAGSQTISVNDNTGCRYDTTITMNQPAILSLSAAIPIDSICASSTGGIANLTASGGTPAYSYSSDGVTFGPASSFTTLAPASYTFTVQDANGCTATATGTINSFPIVNTGSIIPIQQDLTCNGVNTGRIQLTNITGGVRPFTFSLDGGPAQTDSLFINLSAGPHVITISDAKGCTFLYNFTINSPAPIDFDINIIQFETCNNADGILEMTNITGGIAPYTYSFNGGATTPYTGAVTQPGLAANTYTFTVNDASIPGCSLTKNVALPKKPGPTPYVRVNDAICADGNTGSIIVDSVQGGVPPFQYFFNNTNFGGTTVFSNLTEGYYTIDIQDIECVYDIQTYYVWNPDSMYYDTLYNDSLYIGEGLPITATSLTTNSANHLPTGSIGIHSLLNGTRPYQYSFDSLSFTTLIGDTIVQGNLVQGSYTIFVVDSNGCTAQFDFNLKDAFFIPNLITPNGDNSNDFFEIVGLPADSELNIFDRWGAKIYHSDDYTNNWDGETNSDGVYYFELQLKSGANYKGWVHVMR